MDPVLGEIRLFAGSRVPVGWALCQGQLLPKNNQNSALYSLLGTAYGGDGQNNFGLPDLRGRVAINQGQGTGLSPYTRGQTGGEVAHTLTPAELAPHTHSYNADTTGSSSAPASNLFGQSVGRQAFAYYGPSVATVAMHPDMVTTNPGGQPHNNQQPFLVINYIISVTGAYPQRP